MTFRSTLPDIWRGPMSPIREMNRMQRQINRLFDEFLAESFGAREIVPIEEESGFAPACDVSETDSHYLVNFDLPGVKKDDVRIALRGSQLTVSGERKEEFKGRVSRERYYGAFSRSFTLPSDVEADKVEANYENGVLQIALPKSAPSISKQIPVKAGKMIEAKPGKAA